MTCELIVELSDGSMEQLAKMVIPALVGYTQPFVSPLLFSLEFSGFVGNIINLDRHERAEILHHMHNIGIARPPKFVVVRQPRIYGKGWRGVLPIIIPDGICQPAIIGDPTFHYSSWNVLEKIVPGTNIEQTLGVSAEIQYCMWYCGYPADITGLLERAALPFV